MFGKIFRSLNFSLGFIFLSATVPPLGCSTRAAQDNVCSASLASHEYSVKQFCEMSQGLGKAGVWRLLALRGEVVRDLSNDSH
jgi:hypothetical protein